MNIFKTLYGEFDIKNNKSISSKADAVLENKKILLSYRTTTKNEKITNIFIQDQNHLSIIINL